MRNLSRTRVPTRPGQIRNRVAGNPIARPYDKELIPDWGKRGEGGAGWPRLRRLLG